MTHFKHNTKYVFASAAICLFTSNLVSAAKVEGLEKLERMGKYERSLVTYHAAAPTGEHMKVVSKAAEQLSEVNQIRLDRKRPFKLDDTRIGYSSPEDPSASFEMDTATGSFLFNGGLKKYREEESTRNLPAEGEAVDLSQKWLAEMGFTPRAGEMKVVHVGGLNLAVTDGASGSQIFEKLRTVRFGRELNGLAVEGDARITMHLGEDGDLAGMIYQWPEIGKAEKLSRDKLMPAEKMQAAALDQIQSVVGKALRAELTDVDLVLYDDGQGVMEPAYHVVVERYFDYGDDKPVMIPYDFYQPTTVEPQAFYPFMEVAAREPADGREVGKTRSGEDE